MSDHEDEEVGDQQQDAQGGNAAVFVQAATPRIPGIRPPAPLLLDDNLADNWRIFRQTWDHYCILTGVDEHSVKYRVALLLHSLGNEALRVYNGFSFATPETDRTVDEILNRFEEFAVGAVNTTYERFLFNQRTQREGETVDSFIAALRLLIKTCNYCNDCADGILRDRLIIGIRHEETQKALLQERQLTLAQAGDICKAHENAASQGRVLRPTATDNIHGVTKKTPKHQQKQKHQQKPQQKQGTQPTIDCLYCGRQHPRDKLKCPAWEKTCSKCKGKNHFAKMCKQKSVNSMGTADVYIGSVKHGPNQTLFAELHVSNKPVKFQVDTGATSNLLPVQYATEIRKAKHKLVMWNGTVQDPLGECDQMVHNPRTNQNHSISFIVVAENLTPILGLKTSLQLGFVTVNDKSFRRVNCVTASKSSSDLIQEFPDVFDEKLGSLPGIAHFVVDETVPPTISPPRPVPHALRPKLEEEIRRLVDLQVLAPVTEPTDWVSQLVMTSKKNGNIRVCVDPRPLNVALKREHFLLPRLDDILPPLAEAKVFSSFDLSNGYWHVQLDQKSSLLTTFDTPYGRYRWCRLPFGTCVSSEIFQRRLHQAISDLPGVLNVADDILIYGCGTTTDDARKDLTEKTRRFLQRCSEVGIKINKEKMKTNVSEVPFMGHLLTSSGVKPDPEKVIALQDMPAPDDTAGVHRLCGFVNYLSQFMPHLAEALIPLRQLTHKEVKFQWSESQERSFKKIKELASSAPVLKYYDASKELAIQCDASQFGLGAALLQEGAPVAYASRTLTEVEGRYAQIEKELLAIVYSLEKFHQYTFGRHTHVHSDHKPLQSILAKPLSRAPRRLQGMMMRLQKYDVTVTYKKGKDMHLADTLSRAPLQSTASPQEDVAHVHAINYLPISEDRLKALKKATAEDKVMQELAALTISGWPEDKKDVSHGAGLYFHFRDEIVCSDGFLLRGERVIVPSSMVSTILEKLHSSHLGIGTCIRRARECIYWPGMTRDIKDLISHCNVCKDVSTSQAPEPMMPHDIIDRPWAKVGTDLFLFKNKTYLVTVDYFSSFFEIDHLQETSSLAVIRKLKNHFSRYGSPEIVISDNGPQYSSHEFEKFSEEWGFSHNPSSPGHPKSNGKAEAAVKQAKSLLAKAVASGSDPHSALLDLRNAPGPQGDTPAQRAFGRRTRTITLPMTSTLLKPKFDTTKAMVDIKTAQQRQKSYHDRKSQKLSSLKPGDSIRMKPFGTHRYWKPATVLQRLDERSYMIEADGQRYRRNRVHLRNDPVQPQPQPQVPLHQEPSNDAPALTLNSPARPALVDGDVSPPVHNNEHYVTRSGRVVTPPKRLDL